MMERITSHSVFIGFAGTPISLALANQIIGTIAGVLTILVLCLSIYDRFKNKKK